jgi:hypothetical protein
MSGKPKISWKNWTFLYLNIHFFWKRTGKCMRKMYRGWLNGNTKALRPPSAASGLSLSLSLSISISLSISLSLSLSLSISLSLNLSLPKPEPWLRRDYTSIHTNVRRGVSFRAKFFVFSDVSTFAEPEYVRNFKIRAVLLFEILPYNSVDVYQTSVCLYLNHLENKKYNHIMKKRG